MARQPKEEARTEILSQNPVESIPEDDGGMTLAAQEAMPREPVFKGEANAIAGGQVDPTAALVEWYEVLATRSFTGAGGFRAKIHQGKQINSTMYNISMLKKQGVQLRKLEQHEVTV